VRIAIFGLGYVGSVSAACLAAAGHEIVGVDVDYQKLSLIAAGRAPVSEPGLDDLLATVVASGKVTVTSDVAMAMNGAQLSFICVGTPSRRNGSLDTTFLERSISEIGAVLATASSYHVVAIRSTVLPGVLSTSLVPLLEQASGRRAGVEFGVCINPEFLREGSAIRDFQAPPFTLIGEGDSRAGSVVASVYEHLQAPVYRVKPDEASMVKYSSNVFHAIKVTFANEIGAVSQQLGVDGRTVMRIFCEDRDLNISARYLQPGFGFGGSCLPKDLRAMVYVATERDVAVPLLASVTASNDVHIQRVIDTVLDMGTRRVAMLGLSFKSGSDDLRESPFVRLAEGLIAKGVALRIYDADVALGAVRGRNKAYVEERLPHVAQLMSVVFAEVLDGADVIIIGKKMPEIDGLHSLGRNHTVIDLVGIPELPGAIRPWSASLDPVRDPERPAAATVQS
jgi:GDP-mannose 6-dehydrogenase